MVRSADGTRTLLLEDAYVLTLDDQRTRGELSVAVEDTDIVAIGAPRELRDRFPRAARVSCTDRVLMPGLVNAHLHPELHVLKGALEERNLHDWTGAAAYNAAVDYLGTAEGQWIQEVATRASLAEAVLGGTTCVATYGVSAGSETTCERALRDIGLRGTITIRDADFAAVCHGSAWNRSVRAHFRLHAEERLDPPELEAAARAHARGEHIVMHAAETLQRLAIVRAQYGTSTVGVLERYGLLSPQLLLSHAVHVDSDEVRLLAERGVNIVVSPSAELKLADGIPPVQDMQHAGIVVALGTDAAVCNNATDMFLEMRTLGLSQKLRYGASASPAEQILLMATRAGAAVLGGGERFGCLAEGRAADLVLVDTRNARMQPLLTAGEGENLAANLVYAATAGDVTDVMVNGRWVVREGRLETVDTAALWHDLERGARMLYSHALSRS